MNIDQNTQNTNVRHSKSVSTERHILVIEDATDLQEIIRFALESEGYKVSCANNGQEALRFLASCAPTPDLILLDLMMPIMDGFEFRKVQSSDDKISDIPVVVMTAGGDSRAKVNMLGVQGFLKKPADLEQLYSIVKEKLQSLS